ncbi:hypothetical protein AVO45_07780 [Ruegeria marisrubri]|uniref:Uncharacterized protein n=1 Tax=Ruegeria marisrubri TaxID=1685379 RepID=A0A0X3TTQ7_9RHOB|nr:hypothetical protein AVO45_07780 [Ruegeria marisrubri]
MGQVYFDWPVQSIRIAQASDLQVMALFELLKFGHLCLFEAREATPKTEFSADIVEDGSVFDILSVFRETTR